MIITKLRQDIFDSIAQIEDEEFLQAIKVILDNKSIPIGFKLSHFQIERITAVRKQHELGQTQTHEDLLLELDQWLNTK